MNDLHKALGDIRSIRRQIAHSTEFRGYGPATLAGTGVLAVVAAGAQALWLPDPANHISAYLSLWIGTAGFCPPLIRAPAVTPPPPHPSGPAGGKIPLAGQQ